MPPAAKKYALLIGNDRYRDPRLQPLVVPSEDVRGLQAVLADPAVGAFDEVRNLLNADRTRVAGEIERQFKQAARDDLVLLYFSGHGVLDPLGRLYLALAETDVDLPVATALRADDLRDLMETARCRRQVLILDCCYSGAFARAAKSGTAAPAVTPDTFSSQGEGRVALLSSTATQRSFEGERVQGEAQRSVFTHWLVEGLRTGEAAAGAALVTEEALFQYACERVCAAGAGMTPQRWVGHQHGRLVIARNPYPPVATPAPKDLLPADTLADLASANPRTRLGAVHDLTGLLDQPDLGGAARTVLGEHLAAERDYQVRALIEKVLKGAEQPPPVPKPPRSRAWWGLGALLVTLVVALDLGRVMGLFEVPRVSPPSPVPLSEPVRPPDVPPGPPAPNPDSKPTAVVAAPAAAAPGPAVSAAPAIPACAKAEPKSTCRDALKDGSPGPEMVVIPAGSFLMGSPDDEPERSKDEKQHPVDIKEPFAIGKYEVTVAQFRDFVEAKKGYRTEAERGDSCYGWKDGSWVKDKAFSWREVGFPQADDSPVVCVSWNDARDYTAWLSEQTGNTYRLPTEAEWEYAARAGTATPFFTGDCIKTDQANYAGTVDYNDCGAKTGLYRQRTVPVGSLPANAWGLYEMAGNAWEWTCSAYADPYDGKEKVCLSNNDANSGPYRVIRGGSWSTGPSGLRSANRTGLAPSDRRANLGFRLAQDL